MKRILISVGMVVSVLGLTTVPAAASTPITVIYNSTMKPLPANLPSVGAEAHSFSEFGDEVAFAPNTPRNVNKVTVTLSSWGCEQGRWNTGDCVTTPRATFAQLISLKIYQATNTNPSTDPVFAGSPIAIVTQTFNVPYRPSADPLCTGADAGKWFKRGQGCFNGLAVNVAFKFPFATTFPDTIVYGISYNTTHYGYSPIGEAAPCYTSSGGCPYDSLSIALGPTITVGSKPYPDTVFQNAAYPDDYCDATPTVGTFNLDSPTLACWAGNVPAVRFGAR